MNELLIAASAPLDSGTKKVLGVLVAIAILVAFWWAVSHKDD